MSKWSDIFNIFKKQPLTFIESYKEQENVYTFLFEKPSDLDWNPGQHGLFDITHKKIKGKTRPFSIPSIPSENRIQITTKIGEEASPFKQALLELNPGMQIRLSGPVGSFSVKESSPTLLIAGGMGITPFRSILLNVEQTATAETPIHLLYLDSKENYLFQDDLNRVASLPNVSIEFLKSREDLANEIKTFVTQHQNNGTYYMAGPSSFVKSVENQLKEQNVAKKRMHKDDFYGYA